MTRRSRGGIPPRVRVCDRLGCASAMPPHRAYSWAWATPGTTQRRRMGAQARGWGGWARHLVTFNTEASKKRSIGPPGSLTQWRPQLLGEVTLVDHRVVNRTRTLRAARCGEIERVER